ncbi:hypothetical protein MT3620 [Mycobacterium tuberculosis CDC1551]|uniref:Uncharacterized protein n=1 Tax=Mycobacterium tuberculosis (strain CDC 1551 / Oshkosh) TaxID=83331 RepID=Q8VIY7_MYCTO|nr:hypothetical protein MT3620 [Mycobacterium tuberculosis CDC1551]
MARIHRYAARASGLRARLGGARLRLGDHPYAKELASLGLPKRALLSQSAANVEMTSATVTRSEPQESEAISPI